MTRRDVRRWLAHLASLIVPAVVTFRQLDVPHFITLLWLGIACSAIGVTYVTVVLEEERARQQ